MRYLLVASLVFASTPLTAEPAKKPSKKASDQKICVTLASDYEAASKKLAMIKVEGMLDNSAPRATMRATQSTTILDQARFTVGLMKDNGCKAPTAAPSADRYTLAALGCLNERASQRADAAWAKLDGKTVTDPAPAAKCVQDSWVPE